MKGASVWLVDDVEATPIELDFRSSGQGRVRRLGDPCPLCTLCYR